MKNTKIMTVLVILLAAALFIGGASAADAQLDVALATPQVGVGTFQLLDNVTPLASGIVFIGADGTNNITTLAGGVVNITNATVEQYYEDASANYHFIVAFPPVTPIPTWTPAPWDAERDVANTTDAFVFEKITVAGNTNGVQKLTMFTDGATPSVINQIFSDGNGVFYLTEDVVKGNYGTYYLGYITEPAQASAFINIWYPEISLAAELTTDLVTGASSGNSINGQTVNKDTVVSFLISAPKVGPAYSAIPEGPATARITFTTPVSGKTTVFGTENFAAVPLASTQDLVGFTDAGLNAAAGTYTAQAEFRNPVSFRDYAKKSNTISFTLQSPTLTITPAKDTVVRSNPFTVTISGQALTNYAVWLENAVLDEHNPTLQPGQPGFQSAFTAIDTVNVISFIDGGAVFQTDASGKRTIQYNTASNTEEKSYTIRVNGLLGDPGFYDTVIDGIPFRVADLDVANFDKTKVKVEKGSLTITASGDGSYFIGEEIKFTGTNTDSSNVFLFITGQNLNTNGIVLRELPNKVDASEGTNPVAVKTDNTWEFKWDTSQIALDTGAYTIYATSRLTNGKASNRAVSFSPWAENGFAVRLSDSEYATYSLSLKQPFLSAIPSAAVIAQGDTLYIRGTAEGKPGNLMLYIFGPNFFESYSVTVEDDGTYERKIEVTMDANQYFVVVQHPMYNGVFDALLDSSGQDWFFFIREDTTGHSQQSSFVVWGNNKLQGSQAADALTKMIDDANIDDIYTKLTFTAAAPWIRIVNPGDQAVGSKFTITGTTNLAVDDQILVEVISSSFNAVDKTSTSTNSGISQTTKVVAGEGTDNVWSIADVDTTNWKLDEYVIKVNGIEVGASTTVNFNLVEKTAVTPTPTGSETTPTTVPPTTPTTPPTPGFGAFVALAGLGAVALLVLRRN